jgi:hypothetical protein
MSKQIEKKQVNVPAKVNINEVAGFENFDSEKLIVPRLKLVQAMSVEVSDDIAKAGDYVDNVTKEIIAEKSGSITFIPISFNWSRIFFKDLSEGGGIRCRSNNKMGEGDPGGDCKTCPYGQWHKGEDGNNVQECTEIFNVISIITDEDGGLSMPIVISFSKSSAKEGQKLYNLIALQGMRGNSPWVFSYKLSSKFVDGDKGKYYVSTVKPAGKTDDDLVDYLEGIHQMVSASDVEIFQDEDEIRAEQENIEHQDAVVQEEPPF